MNTPPPKVQDSDLLGTLQSGWAFEAVSLEYVARGFGSHHWVAVDSAGTKRFVTVDELSKLRVGNTKKVVFARLAAAFGTARLLRDNGLDFVVAPLTDVSGSVLRRLGDSFSLAVFPYVDGYKPSWGEFRSDEERRAVLARVLQLHEATPVVADMATREDFRLPCRTQLESAMGELGQPWLGGPHSEPARQLLIGIETDLLRALDLFDVQVAEVRSERRPWVITHGEPHAGNIIWTALGPHLVDWDTALIAPASRDLWMLDPANEAVVRDEPPAYLLYRLWWDLAEIAGYVAAFRLPHEATADSLESWRNLEHYARLSERWGERLSNSS